jgi:hypothetical protein
MLRKVDPILAVALILALVFSLYGIRWGRVECWNRDQMALRGLHGLRPSAFLKPPFHTYLNHFVVLNPIERAEFVGKKLLRHDVNLNEMRLLASRLLVVGMFLGTIALAFAVSRQAFGLFAARVIALLFATSAGFIEYDHFLSCDSPLLFWMMLTLFFAQRITVRPEISNYVLAGLLTGICTATKYNGLAIGITIVVAHFFSQNEGSIKERLLSRRLFLGLLMVPVGFIAGNPYAILDWRKFSADFLYNYYVTPRYEGQTSGHGYGEFLMRVPELMGLPGAVLVAAAITMSILFILRRRNFRSPATLCFALAAGVFLVYYAKIGSFPRTQTRFILPVAPFLILMTGPFWRAMSSRPKWISALLIPVLTYNAVCCFFVGHRFSEDPRTKAQAWIIDHTSRGLVLESSAGSPHWEKLPGLPMRELDAANPKWEKARDYALIDLRMPHVHGRYELFSKLFENNPWVSDYAKKIEGQPNEQLFTQDELSKRNPNIVTVYSSDYEVPNQTARTYYAEMLAGRLGYDIAFDGRTADSPRWIYPRDIDFLRGRVTILTRR